jgi:pyridoxine 4-dehydrogenase
MDQIERARKIVSIVSVQNRYSFADREWDYVVRLLRAPRDCVHPVVPAGVRQGCEHAA